MSTLIANSDDIRKYEESSLIKEAEELERNISLRERFESSWVFLSDAKYYIDHHKSYDALEFVNKERVYELVKYYEDVEQPIVDSYYTACDLYEDLTEEIEEMERI
jgi:hypothetical protein